MRQPAMFMACTWFHAVCQKLHGTTVDLNSTYVTAAAVGSLAAVGLGYWYYQRQQEQHHHGTAAGAV